MTAPLPNRRGFTLIEVLLAIALSTVLLALLGTAINMHLLRVGASRDTVEQAQLARGVLRTIVDDLRSVAVVVEQDISSAEAAAAAQALFDVDEADADPPDLDEDSGSGSGTSDSTSDSAAERPYAGIQGDAQSLQIDVNRVRPAYVVSADTPDLPPRIVYDSPGLNTVRYLLTPEGLVRQQAPRDRRIFEEAQGRDDIWQASSRVLASEVAELRFTYSDGEQVLEYWDIDEQAGALPATVQVTIGLRFPSLTADGQADPNAELTYYTLTAPMPAAEEEEAETESTASGGDA